MSDLHPALARIAERLSVRGDGSFSLYKEGCFRRRIEVRMRARSMASLDDYADLLDREPMEIERLAEVLSIGVTGFFRNPTAWRRLETLLAEEPTVPRAGWSAGCATGEEAYSLGFVLARRAPGSWRVDATDIDREALGIGRAGRYPASAGSVIAAYSPGALLAEWGHHDDAGFEVDGSIRRGVHWSVGNLTDEWTGPPRYDVVVCRNVLIYFGAEGQQRVLTSLARGLKRRGLLFLGKAELALHAEEVGLEAVDPRERIYRRAG
ncbi:MAG: protein-glutamate O-methyltransferase CheR [Gemmatimonadota bacterium]